MDSKSSDLLSYLYLWTGLLTLTADTWRFSLSNHYVDPICAEGQHLEEEMNIQALVSAIAQQTCSETQNYMKPTGMVNLSKTQSF